MAKYSDPEMPFVESHYQGAGQRPTLIALRPSMTTSEAGAALGVATRYHSKSSPHDAPHYVVDDETRFRCVEDDTIAGHWHCEDKGAIRVMLCAEPVSRVQFWDEIVVHKRVLHNAARLVADLTLLHKIRPEILCEEDLVRWKKHKWRRRGGIFVDASGYDFPIEDFLAEVKAQRALKTHI